MEAETPVATPRGGRPARARIVLPRYDQALLAAKNSNRLVDLVLAVDTPDTTDAVLHEVEIMEVDKFQLKVKLLNGKEVWVGKTMIVQTEIRGK